MNKSMISGILVGVVVATAGGAIANYAMKTRPAAEQAETTTAPTTAATTQESGTPAATTPTTAPEQQQEQPQPAASIAPAFADVIAVAAVKESTSSPRQQCTPHEIQVPRQSCHMETVTHQRPVSDEHRVAGSIAGAAAGALLGKQVGGGKGKKAATLLGAIAGGYAGNQVQKNMQENDTYTTQEERCETVYDTQTQQDCKTVYDKREQTVGYDVTYQLGDKQGQVRMKRNPGKQIPVKDGVLVTD